MTTKHTPGPWRIEEAPEEVLANHVGISADEHSLLAQVVYRMEDDERTPSCEANARLIAAAPELLDVVMATMPLLESLNECGLVPITLQRARAAIAKATGA